MSGPSDSQPEAGLLDREAMERLAAGEDLALNGIMERWKRRLVSYLYRLTGNEAAALDLAEETFVRVYQGRMIFRKEKPFATWLFGIAANLARNHLRWRHRHPSLPMEEALGVTSGENPARDAETSEREKAVRTAIASLPHDLRESLVLDEYEGLSHAEIAAIAGCSPRPSKGASAGLVISFARSSPVICRVKPSDEKGRLEHFLFKWSQGVASAMGWWARSKRSGCSRCTTAQAQRQRSTPHAAARDATMKRNCSSGRCSA